MVVDAGADQTIPQGGRVVLGGALPASGGSGTFAYAWTPATGLDRSDVPHPTASPNQTTTYTLTVTDPGSCQKEARVTVTVSTPTPTAMAAAWDPWGLHLFPNPTHGVFTLASEHPMGTKILLLAVYSVLGQRVYAESILAGSHKLEQLIQLPPQAAGLYFVQITGQDVNRVFRLQVQ
ncbi:T9SS type A sorting domain-containing protein [Hymenobacter elongatus]|uniref:T9SS type A sorting domain-containing protein n=1 Tax=Hymenobacter elongatus TaxID=877208 RepID=UPI0014368CAE|nr:T9SS type A sorting domain-containing protein [Hymenobacter elongatus]